MACSQNARLTLFLLSIQTRTTLQYLRKSPKFHGHSNHVCWVAARANTPLSHLFVLVVALHDLVALLFTIQTFHQTIIMLCVDTRTSTALVDNDNGSLSPASRLLELWQNDDDKTTVMANDELELDLLSENGIIQEEWLLKSASATEKDAMVPHDCGASLLEFDLLDFNDDDNDELVEQHLVSDQEDEETPEKTKLHFNYNPPSMIVVNGKAVFTTSPTKRRKVSEDGEYIPSVQDLNLPPPMAPGADAVSKFLHHRLNELVQEFQSSYESVMESKRKVRNV